MRNYYIFIGALSIFVITLLVIGFTSVTNPFSERDKKLDEKRASDFASISNSINNFYQEKNRLPDSISALKPTTYERWSIIDPGTSAEYEYKEDLINSSFSLCTTFSTDTKTGNTLQTSGRTVSPRAAIRIAPVDPYMPIQPDQDLNQNLTPGQDSVHPRGYYCYVYSIPSFYNKYYNNIRYDPGTPPVYNIVTPTPMDLRTPTTKTLAPTATPQPKAIVQ